MDDLPGSVSSPRRHWAQVGRAAPEPRSFWPAVMATWLLSAVPMYIHLKAAQYSDLRAALADHRPVLVVFVLLLGVLALTRGTPLLGVAAGVVLVPAAQWWNPFLAGEPARLLVGLAFTWAVVTGVLAPSSGGRWRRSGRWPSARALRLAVPSLIATDVVLVLTEGPPPAQRLLVASVALVVVCLVAPRALDRAMSFTDPIVAPLSRLGTANARLLDRVGRPIGRVLGALAMVPAAIVTFLVWVSHRITGYNPLGSSRRAATYWSDRQGMDTAPAHAFAEVRVVGANDVVQAGRRRFSVVPLVVAAVGLGVLGLTLANGDADADGEEVGFVDADACSSGADEAMDSQRSWPLVGCETTEYTLSASFDPVTVFTFDDYESTWVNETDGERRTWTPPECANCTELEVWWFGGSAAWGYYQSDERSLPSQVARVAHEQGIRLHVTNFAQPGWTLGQEVRKFIDLTTERSAPDLVVFYDGANDVILQRDRNRIGRGGDESEVTFAEEALDELISGGPFDWNLRAEDRSPTRTVTLDTLEPLEDVARHAMARYTRNMALGQSFADQIGTEAVFFWQPILPAAPERAGASGAMSQQDRSDWSKMLPAIREAMPDGVVDLSDSLDDAERAVFKDYVHTNEYGAELVAHEVVAGLSGRMGQDAGMG